MTKEKQKKNKSALKNKDHRFILAPVHTWCLMFSTCVHLINVEVDKTATLIYVGVWLKKAWNYGSQGTEY